MSAVHFSLDVFMVYDVDIMSYRKWPQTSRLNNRTVREIFTDIINRVRRSLLSHWLVYVHTESLVKAEQQNTPSLFSGLPRGLQMALSIFLLHFAVCDLTLIVKAAPWTHQCVYMKMPDKADYCWLSPICEYLLWPWLKFQCVLSVFNPNIRLKQQVSR